MNSLRKLFGLMTAVMLAAFAGSAMAAPVARPFNAMRTRPDRAYNEITIKFAMFRRVRRPINSIEDRASPGTALSW